MNILTRDDHGTFLLTTTSGSTYRITSDADTATMTRVPASVPTAEVGEVSQLRRDGQEVVILGFHPIQVGNVAMFALAPLSDNGADVTFRRTSAVTGIERVV